MIGKSETGGFNTSPTAAYPVGMCLFLAKRMFEEFIQMLQPTFGGGGAPTGHRRREVTRATGGKSASAQKRETSFWKSGGRAWQGSLPEDRWTRNEKCFMNVDLNDLNCHEYIPHETIIDKISQEIDSVGVDIPIKRRAGEQ